MTRRARGGDARRKISTLEVILTASCNLRCAYCYQNAKQPRRMEWATLEASLDLLLRSDHTKLNILFLGGEPLLELPLIRRAVRHVRERLPSGKQVSYSISTNGLLLDDEAIRLLFIENFQIQLSFDGVPAAQDARGIGTHAKLDDLLARLERDYEPLFRNQLSIAITLHSDNVSHLADSVGYFMDRGIPLIRLTPLATHDAGWSGETTAELDRQFARISERSLAHVRATGDVPFEPLRRTAERSHHHPSGGAMCGVAGGEAIAVDPDGEVTGCVTFSQSYQRLPPSPLSERVDAMRVGHVRSIELRRRLALYPEAADAARIFGEKQAKRSTLASCGECRFLDECTVCPTSILHIPGNADPDRIPDNACAYNLVMLAHRERFPATESDSPLVRLTKLVERARGSSPRARRPASTRTQTPKGRSSDVASRPALTRPRSD